MTVKIVFRGLLLFNEMNGAMQIGVLGPAHAHGASASHGHAPAHIPRIITTRNGVISSVFDLRTRPELRPPGEPGHIRNWEIFVTAPHPSQNGVKTDQQGPWDRINHTHARDYRFLTHLEGTDLHGEIADLRTDRLMMVLRVPVGEFYTDQLSKPLRRKTVTEGAPNGAVAEYGMAAEVTGCDILTTVNTEVELRVDDNVVFRFRGKSEDGVVYEFSNAPPDVLPDRVYSPNEPSHFSQYYGLFSPSDRFDLIPQVDFAPAPDPALCGAARVDPRSGGI